MNGPSSDPNQAVSPETTAESTTEKFNIMNWTRTLLVLFNFGLTVVFSFILFFLDLRTSAERDQTGVARTSITYHGANPPAGYPLKKEFTDATLIGVNEIPALQQVWADEDQILQLSSVHAQFLFMIVLFVSSAFNLSLLHLNILKFQFLRVAVVHVWNLLLFVLTILAYSRNVFQWGHIPTSNLVYGLIAQAMAWTYQYFFMVECTQEYILKENRYGDLKLQTVQPAGATDASEIYTNENYPHAVRKNILMEYSIIAPILLVITFLPGTQGMDEWQVQTILFAGWTLFALMNLYYRYFYMIHSGGKDGHEFTGTEKQVAGDALGYLAYAILVLAAQLVNAMWNKIFLNHYYPYLNKAWFADSFAVCQWIIAGIVTLLFLDVLYKAMNYFLQDSSGNTIADNFKSGQDYLNQVAKRFGDDNGTFVLNFIILIAGIVLKIISYVAMHQAYKFNIAVE
jgi:hypothetical protein